MSQPVVYTEINFVPFGPQVQVERLRTWVNNRFRQWARREFNMRADGTARRREGDLRVTLEVWGSPQEIIGRIAQDFSSLRFHRGYFTERSQWSFTATDGHIEYEFTDGTGDLWRGADGHYEKCPYEDEDDDEEVESAA